jgi:hypothetical protein
LKVGALVGKEHIALYKGCVTRIIAREVTSRFEPNSFTWSNNGLGGHFPQNSPKIGEPFLNFAHCGANFLSSLGF